MRRPLTLLCAISILWAARANAADPAVRVDPAAKVLTYAGGSVPIALPQVVAKDVTIEDVTVGPGQKVTHVKIAASPNAWEALVAHSNVVFAGLTGFTRGEEGEKTGEAVQILPRAPGTQFVVVGDVRQDRTICGQAMTVLSPRVLDPQTMELRGASMQRLSAAQRKDAQRIVASARNGAADPALAHLLVAEGASTGNAKALTDGDLATVWTEERPGVGQGEFVRMRASHEVAITRLAITPAPPAPNANGAAPQAFYLVTDDRTFAVTMPGDAWMHPGEAYDIPLPEPVHTGCVSLVLDAAYVRGTAPEVSVAELVAYSEFDGPSGSLEKVAGALAGGGARADGAAAMLKRAPGGLAAVRAVYTNLDAAGRALAMDVAASAATCSDAAPLLVKGLADGDREVARKSREKLERCGKTAAPAYAEAMRTGTADERVVVASMFAEVAPRDALVPLADAVASGDDKVRIASRKALAHAARRADAHDISSLLTDRTRKADARLEIVRALGPRLADARTEANEAFGELLAPGASMRTRYLAAAPMAELARAGDPSAAARLAALVTKDPDGPVRARAAEVSGGIPSIEASITRAAADDSEPRVREAALRTVASAHAKSGEAAARGRLADDPWTFVRTAAAGALAALPASPAAEASLAKALRDASPRVRAASISGLAAHRATTEVPALLERVGDDKEDVEVKVAALRALGQMCARTSTDALTSLASRGSAPMADEDERSLGLAAIEALGHLHPADLAARLAKARAPDANVHARRAADAALREREVCR